MKFEQDFKDALKGLPEKEKDKLLLRLLKKDLSLANQLYFQLIETRSVEELRTEVETKIVKFLKNRGNQFYSPGVLMMVLRDTSGMINEHVSNTKDKYGDPYLNCVMLINTLQANREHLLDCTKYESFKLYAYIVARIFKILSQVKVLHEDLQYDFQELFENLLDELVEIPNLMDATIFHGLDLNWIHYRQIPDDIVAIQKDLRQRGYLK